MTERWEGASYRIEAGREQVLGDLGCDFPVLDASNEGNLI
jgi:hypothetical protein